jgi:hypothetical protein
MTPLAALADPVAITQQVDMLEAYFGAELEPHVKRLYVDALRDMPVEHLRAGCRRVVASARFMPKVAEIRAAVDTELSARRLLEAPPTDYPPEYRACQMCEDSGWRITKDGVPPTVTRCACYVSNPILARQRGPAKYDQSEAR